ncbi:MAG: glycosyltransferase [Acidimicrobiia bacterium]
MGSRTQLASSVGRHAVGALALSYVLPLRKDSVEDVAELARYVRGLAMVVDDLLVMDGSPPEVFEAHAAAFGPGPRHLPPDPRHSFANGKVDGVLTGVELARNEAVVIADDDVRWDAAGLARAAALLGAADVVRPQNYFEPLPWHARWDTARSLLNRAFGADYPGTLAVRRSTLLSAGGYDGDAMFENLELMRTVRAVGGSVHSPLDLYVRRLPPTARQFRNQRVRQAFDDFAQPPRLVASLAVVPLVVAALVRRRLVLLAALVLVPMGVAERGRRRGGGRSVFPASCVAFAPAWVLERAVCSWIAVGCRVLWGGPRYRGRVMRLAATPSRVLRRRLRRPG